MLVVRDGVGMAYMGRPFACYLCLGVDTERFDRLRGPVGLPAEISFLVYPGLSWGSGEPPECGDASVFMPGRAIVVGHTQATFRLTRRRSVSQRASHWSGCVPSFPIHIEWGKGESFSL